MLPDADFAHIAPRLGGRPEAFEELCCQLASRTLDVGSEFHRLHGAGGDGGVECYCDCPDGHQIGWQAKYVFEVDALLAQANKSVSTALALHSTLTRYILCFPFNLSGETRRRGRSGVQKYETWQAEKVAEAREAGRVLEIEIWEATKLRQLLLQYDASGGMRQYFFDERILTPEWFAGHLDHARVSAGPRYTLEPNIATPLGAAIDAIGCTSAWHDRFDSQIRDLDSAVERLSSQLSTPGDNALSPPWPVEARSDVESCLARVAEAAQLASTSYEQQDQRRREQCIELLRDAVARFESISGSLREDIEREHGPGTADSPGFRQFMAEVMVSFPTANLDVVVESTQACATVARWLESPEGKLPFESAMLITGVAGSGKTHGIVDAALKRASRGLLSCVLLGHLFGDSADPWIRTGEILGLPSLGRDRLLDALEAAAAATGSYLLVFLDAVNESRPLRYWKERIAAFAQELVQRRHLRLCLSCRTPFLEYCLPPDYEVVTVEHTGFKGVEREACTAFFTHNGLEVPMLPVLHPELSNPLYLTLACKALKAEGLTRLSPGWYGLVPVIDAFLKHKEQQFADEHDTPVGAHIVRGALSAIAVAISESASTALPWSTAHDVAVRARPQAGSIDVVAWLVRSNLLIEDAPLAATSSLGVESTVHPAFERLGDLLVAKELLKGVVELPGGGIRPAGNSTLERVLRDSTSVGANAGLIMALAMLLPEQYPEKEVPDLVEGGHCWLEVRSLTMRSLPWRDASSYSARTVELVEEGLATSALAFETMDNVIASAWQVSRLDALWLDSFLRRRSMAQRDAYWCPYLHDRYDASVGPIRGLIETASELPLEQVAPETAERWIILLCWFLASSDRRVKDNASRAIVALFSTQTQHVSATLERFLPCDDDEVRERTLACVYGALLISHDAVVTREVLQKLHTSFGAQPSAFDNAVLRDHVRCVCELAVRLQVLPAGLECGFSYGSLGTGWPLLQPSDDEIRAWDALPKLVYSCLHDDFYVYSLSRLRGWEHGMNRQAMGRWVLMRVAEGLGYEDSGCERHDRYLLGRYGGGRAKPTWAERIGKKYQWIAMNQLASRLHDHVLPAEDSVAAPVSRPPLILADGRKQDPSLPMGFGRHEHDSDCWWVASRGDPEKRETLEESEWVTRTDDLPDLGVLLHSSCGGRRWIQLCSYNSWGKPRPGDSYRARFRNMWLQVQSYLVHVSSADEAFRRLSGRNFFGRWLPDAPTTLWGFAGEYPGGVPFDEIATESGFRSVRGRDGGQLMLAPSWGELVVEWEYDASLANSVHMMVPCRMLFDPGDLWWNGRDGYCAIDGKTVFRDPSVLEPGCAALLADREDLVVRLRALGLGLVWTVVGEKWILGGRHDEVTPRRTFSQAAVLDSEGGIRLGQRVCFEDYSRDAELL